MQTIGLHLFTRPDEHTFTERGGYSLVTFVKVLAPYSAARQSLRQKAISFARRADIRK